jgi:hypothetical protein
VVSSMMLSSVSGTAGLLRQQKTPHTGGVWC